MSPHPVTELIRQRRSVKPELMQPDSLPRESIDLLLENATWAPTHGLTEPWRFFVFEGASRERLAATLQELYTSHTPADQVRPEKLAKLGRNPLLAPVVIAIGMERDPSGKIPEIEEVAAVACAVQNMHLTATALGLGAFWSSPPLIYTEAMRAFLGLAEGGKCLGLFYVGFPKDGIALESRRTAVAEKAVWL